MKRVFILVGLSALFLVGTAQANVSQDVRYQLNRWFGAQGAKVPLGDVVNANKGLVVGRFNYTLKGGGTTGDVFLVNDLNNPLDYASLPNNAIITNAFINVITAPSSTNTGTTVAVKVQGLNDILSALSYTAWGTGSYKQGVPTGATTTFIKLTAKRFLKAQLGVSGLSAGKFDVFIEYVLGNP